jgi:hypothetical protein
MRRLGWVALALVFMMSTDALAPPAYAKRVALVVGINKYDKLRTSGSSSKRSTTPGPLRSH